ncbi:UNVERIFIED_CONTAM: protein trichome birefringence [Sesamum radiatum]|uniref:Protein trichome birefringence n=1 Tax=Sesamum radiatum TaxID=300843 RepID=A0AAW2NRX5_SESRA
MADIAKYTPIHGGTLISDFKAHFSIFRTKRTVALAYTLVFVFIAISFFFYFLLFFPQLIILGFTIHNSSTTDTSGSQNIDFLPPNLSKGPSVLENQTNTHKVEALKPLLNQTATDNTNPLKPTPELSKGSSDVSNQTQNKQLDHKGEVLKQNQTQSEEFQGRVQVLKANQSTNAATNSPETANTTVGSSPKSASEMKNVTANGDKGVAENGAVKNLTSSLMMKQNNGTDNAKVKQGIDDRIKSLMNCDLFDGNWVRDDSYPLYKPGSCSLIDEQFNCFLNGRPDNDYYKLKWKPKGCTLPRLDGSHMLELLRGKRLVFVGDSLNRNMWESLICILRNSVKDQKKVYEEFGRHHFRTEASYSFIFEDYKCTVEFFVSPFLVQEWELADRNGTKKETLRLDLVSRSADKYKNADIIVFNTGHWWTHEKTSKGKDYYQEGSHVYGELNVLEAFRKAITTWGRWVDANINQMKTLVFFRGYSASHFRQGDHETEPIKNETYLSQYPPKMTVVEKVLKGMNTPVTYLNITRMTDYRKDGHPSMYRKQHMSDEERRSPFSFQDCSHWCLPGVPDAWNEILYAELLVKLNQKQQSQKRP